MKKARYSGGDFHPVSAVVYGPNRTRLASGEQAQDHRADPIVVISSTRIRSPRALYTWEQEQFGRKQGASDLMIEVRNEGGGDQLTTEMWFVHLSIAYYIKGRRPTDWEKGVTPYQVTTTDDYRM